MELLVLTIAGMNSVSNWSVNEAVKLPGRSRNRRVIKTQFVKNKRMLRMKKTIPRFVNQADRNGTGDVSVPVGLTLDSSNNILA